jgi:SAM-dependent methyltransferase
MAPRAGPTARIDAPAYPDFIPSPNVHRFPDLYDAENAAMDPGGLVLAAMDELAPWAGRTIVDLGCGTGWWLPRYAAQAGHVIGIEPAPATRLRALRRVAEAGLHNASVLAGSAEHTGLATASADVIHARFAYFFGPGADAGLAETLRVLRPGGALVVVDNDWRTGEFASLLQQSLVRPGTVDPDAVAAWWAARGAERRDVMSRWQFPSRDELAAVLRIEFPAAVADGWLAANASRTGLSYGYTLWTVRKPLWRE